MQLTVPSTPSHFLSLSLSRVIFFKFVRVGWAKEGGGLECNIANLPRAEYVRNVPSFFRCRFEGTLWLNKLHFPSPSFTYPPPPRQRSIPFAITRGEGTVEVALPVHLYRVWINQIWFARWVVVVTVLDRKQRKRSICLYLGLLSVIIFEDNIIFKLRI